MDESGAAFQKKIDSLCRDYGSRAGEIAAKGGKVIGYICSFVPVEIIHAAGAVPFRIRGDLNEPITKGDTNLETIACPFMRSCFDLSVKGRYGFIEGILVPHACDSMARTYSVWQYCLDLPYSHFINIPHTLSESSLDFFQSELKSFITSISRYTGKEAGPEELKRSISIYNENRKRVREIYELRKRNPPLVSGTEVAMLLIAGASLPVEEANDLYDEALEVYGKREVSQSADLPRILIDGACIDNVDLIRLVEESGASVVVDTLCLGTRDHWPDVDEQSDPVKALAKRYLVELNCPRTYREKQTGDYSDDLEERFWDIRAFAGNFSADGAIMYQYKYCDPFGFEVLARKTFFESLGIPSLYLEDEYSTGTIGQLKTRIQAFIEMLE